MAPLVRDRAGRAAGIAVFVLGVCLLLVVFYLGYLEVIASGALAGPPGRPAGDVALFIAAKGLFLFVLGFVASAIANKGISLYQASGGTSID
jgi:hypothetical protein